MLQTNFYYLWPKNKNDSTSTVCVYVHKSIHSFNVNNLEHNATLKISCHRKFQFVRNSMMRSFIANYFNMYSNAFFSCMHFLFLFLLSSFFFSHTNRLVYQFEFFGQNMHICTLHIVCIERGTNKKRKWSLLHTNDKFKKWEIWYDLKSVSEIGGITLTFFIFILHDLLPFLIWSTHTRTHTQEEKNELDLWMGTKWKRIKMQYASMFFSQKYSCQFKYQVNSFVLIGLCYRAICNRLDQIEIIFKTFSLH